MLFTEDVSEADVKQPLTLVGVVYPMPRREGVWTPDVPRFS